MIRSRIDLMLERYALWLLRRRIWVLCFSSLLCFLLALGARNLYFVDDYRVYFSKDNPQLQAFEALEKTYTKNDNILFVVNHKTENVFHTESLLALDQLTREGWQLPYSIRVDSLINFQHSYAEGDDLVVEDLFGDPSALDEAQRDTKATAAMQEPRLVGRLLAQDAGATGVLITFQLPEDQQEALVEIAQAVRILAQNIQQQFPQVEVRLTGELMINVAFQEVGNGDAAQLTPLMYVTIFLLVLCLLRSLVGALTILLLITLSVLAALGAAGWAGLYMTVTSVAAPTMIMTLAVADGVHLFISLFTAMREGKNQDEALVHSVVVNAVPVVITSVTTAIGFLSLNLVDVPPFKDFGNISAMGVMVACLLSLSLLPALVACCRLKPRKKMRVPAVFDLGRLGGWVVRRKGLLIWLMPALFLFLLAAIPRNEVNNEIVKYFSHEIEFRRDSDFSQQHLTGLYTVEYDIPGQGEYGITAPKYLKNLDAFANWLRAQPEVVHVSVFSDTMKRLNKNLHGDEQSWYQVPEEAALASQYLLLYELSLPYGLDLNNEINLNKSASRVVVTLGDLSTNAIKAFRDKSENWLRTQAPDQFAYAVGASVMFADIFKRSTETMIEGVLVGMLLISLVLMVALRSSKFGLLSIIPNLLPAGLAFGIWGLWVGQVNMGVSLVMTMTLGIVVDDTVHFMSKYLRARRQFAYDSAQAIRYAFSSVGFALVVTSIALVAGFAVMAQSSFALNADSAAVTLLAILLALVVDFLFLPPMLIYVDRDKTQPDAVAQSGQQ